MKEQVINNVVVKSCDFLTVEQQRRLNDVLFMELYNYELVKKKEEETLPIAIDDYNYELLKKFLVAKMVCGLSERSIELYKLRLEHFILNINKRVNQATTDDIRYYIQMYKVTRNVSNTTLDSIRRIIRSFYSWLVDEEIITKNPMNKIQKIKLDTIKEDKYSKTDIELLRDGCKNKRDRAILEFLYCTGCRVSEMVSINRRQINVYTKELEIIGKGNKQRTIYLTDLCLYYLKEYLDTRDDDNEALFVSLRKKYKRLSKGGIEAMLRNLGNQVGVNNCHPHRFRRTLCCNFIDYGVDITTVQDILGHSSINTTMIYYNSNKNKAKMAYMN